MAVKALKSFGDIFGEDTEEMKQSSISNEPKMLAVDQLKPYAKRRFALYTGERLSDMIESIRKNGILQPIIARSLVAEEYYEILAGHNRVNAAKAAGLTEVPGYVLENLSDEAAEIYYFETNLLQRSFNDLAHSEKAAVLAIYHSKLFSQGKRNDILTELEELSKLDGSRDEATSSQIAKKLTSLEMAGQEYGLSKDSVARYLRINKLIEEFKMMVDEGSVPFIAGVDLSYLSDEQQQMLVKNLSVLKGVKLDLKKAKQLKEAVFKEKLTETTMMDILTDRNNGKPTKKLGDVKIKKTVLKKYFAEDVPAKVVEDTIQKALDMYFSQENGVM